MGAALLGVVGGGAFLVARTQLPTVERPVIPRARTGETPSLPSQAPHVKQAPDSSSPEGSSLCVVPALPEGVKAKDIRSRPEADLSFQGGKVEKGKYRVVDSFALEPGFTPGRWTLALDLTDNHQGAYYRPAGLTFRSSRIRWSVQGNSLEWETVCPDPGERMSFEFTVVGARLYLLTREKIVVVLEPYADSEVNRLAPVDDP